MNIPKGGGSGTPLPGSSARTECENLTAPWSEQGRPPSICPSCGGVMPLRHGRLLSWRERGLDRSKVRVTSGQRPLRIKHIQFGRGRAA